ncbi:MAG: SpoIID/LytB domain-containing protein [Synergistaceae bacterium]|nr:SpoIID/LytB domain-containing protein [Synergistaceae bacterium]
MKNTFKLCLLSLLSILAFTLSAESRDIYVRLADRPSSAALTSEGAMTLVDAAGKSHGLGKSAVLKPSGVSVVVGKHKYPLPAYISSSKLLGFNGRKYRGKLFLTKEFVLINVVDVEDYVRGVLPAEASSSWPKEYLKVQAIISRTYGLLQSLNRSARGYDVGDTSSNQVYKGAGVETSATNQAIKETEGEVLAYKDALAFTPFHSDSGGHTATNAHVWGKDVPYLKGVKEPVAYQSPNTSWTAKIPASQVQAALSKIGSNVGRVKEVRVAESDAGGRAINLTFVGSSGSSSVKSSIFRTAIGPNLLKSTMLTTGVPMAEAFEDKTPQPPAKTEAKEPEWSSNVSGVSGGGASFKTSVANALMSGNEEARLMQMTSDGVFTSAELMDMLINPDKRKDYLNVGIQRGSEAKKAPPPAPLPKSLPGAPMPALRPTEPIREENGFFVFRGRGWGHGVGLSQWGAQALAQKGWAAERILEHYYPGTTVKRFK